MQTVLYHTSYFRGVFIKFAGFWFSETLPFVMTQNTKIITVLKQSETSENNEISHNDNNQQSTMMLRCWTFIRPILKDYIRYNRWLETWSEPLMYYKSILYFIELIAPFEINYKIEFQIKPIEKWNVRRIKRKNGFFSFFLFYYWMIAWIQHTPPCMSVSVWVCVFVENENAKTVCIVLETWKSEYPAKVIEVICKFKRFTREINLINGKSKSFYYKTANIIHNNRSFVRSFILYNCFNSTFHFIVILMHSFANNNINNKNGMKNMKWQKNIKFHMTQWLHVVCRMYGSRLTKIHILCVLCVGNMYARSNWV